MHPALDQVNKYIFKPYGLSVSGLVQEKESQEYAASSFQLGAQKVLFRLAKTTPKKVGQFVTFWKRNLSGVTVPFDVSDNFDLLIIAVRKEEQLGVFIFTKQVLLHHNIISDDCTTGKRGMRVYPTWYQTNNKQAQGTQAWQARFFLDISVNNTKDFDEVKKLLSISGND